MTLVVLVIGEIAIGLVVVVLFCEERGGVSLILRTDRNINSLTQLGNGDAVRSFPVPRGLLLALILTTPHVHLHVAPEFHEKNGVHEAHGHGAN